MWLLYISIVVIHSMLKTFETKSRILSTRRSSDLVFDLKMWEKSGSNFPFWSCCWNFLIISKVLLVMWFWVSIKSCSSPRHRYCRLKIWLIRWFAAKILQKHLSILFVENSNNHCIDRGINTNYREKKN